MNGRSGPDLQALVVRAREIAIQLLDTTDKLRTKGVGKMNQNNKWGCFRQALELILKKGAIEDLASRLGRIREQLQFHLVMETRHVFTYVMISVRVFTLTLEMLRQACYQLIGASLMKWRH